jgi:putative sigma-54 modulation protein
MNTHIVGRGLELTEPIKRYVESAFESIKKYNLDIISASAILSDNKKGEFSVEFIVNVKDKHTVVITQRDKDLYAAIDLAVERVKKNLRRYADKIKDHSGVSIKDIELLDEDSKVTPEV